MDPLEHEEKSFLRTTSNEEINKEKDMEAVPMDPRSCILGVGTSAGKLCAVANQMVPELQRTVDSERESESPSTLLTEALAELFASLWLTAKSLRLDWVKSIRSKMALNAKKYPVEHCKVRSASCQWLAQSFSRDFWNNTHLFSTCFLIVVL